MPQLYGDHGSMEMSTNLSDWALAQFNFDAEIYHRSTLEGPIDPESLRGMIIEFKNLRVQRAVRYEPVNCAFASLASDPAAKPDPCGTTPTVARPAPARPFVQTDKRSHASREASLLK